MAPQPKPPTTEELLTELNVKMDALLEIMILTYKRGYGADNDIKDVEDSLLPPP